MNKQTVYALQELEILHALLIQQENRGNHEQASLRWAVGCFMDELVERRIENNFEQVAYGDKKPSPNPSPREGKNRK